RVTFCNERSIKVFRKFGWREAYDASVCTLPILGGPFRLALRALALGAPRWETEPLPRDAAALSGLLDDASPAPTRIVRDEDWARWRLLDHPRSAEYRLARLDGVAAVLRLFTSSGRRRAHLLHVGPGARAKRARVVSAFARWAIEQDADRAWMATNDPALLTASVPRLPRRFALRFAWHSEDKAVSAALEAGLPTQGLDSDHDLMFPC
ncbi:MAG: hypothetical protein HYZ74_04945, partial [Elusimicrobia bacterium]|nr:hypothetical protein [Elusimicrobiota bacterium]